MSSREHRITARAIQLIEDPQNWHQGHGFARGVDGRPINLIDENAKTFCAWGAICRAAYDITNMNITTDEACHLLRSPHLPNDYSDIVQVNERLGWEGVMKVLKLHLESTTPTTSEPMPN